MKFSEKGHNEYQKKLAQQIDSRFKSFAEQNAEKRKAYEVIFKHINVNCVIPLK